MGERQVGVRGEEGGRAMKNNVSRGRRRIATADFSNFARCRHAARTRTRARRALIAEQQFPMAPV